MSRLPKWSSRFYYLNPREGAELSILILALVIVFWVLWTQPGGSEHWDATQAQMETVIAGQATIQAELEHIDSHFQAPEPTPVLGEGLLVSPSPAE